LRLVEGLCEESGGKELCLELVDIYQVAYLLFLPCLAHAYIYIYTSFFSTCHDDLIS
jgi:hypothetical protein